MELIVARLCNRKIQLLNLRNIKSCLLSRNVHHLTNSFTKACHRFQVIRGAKRLPFEIDTKVPKDVLLFTNKNRNNNIMTGASYGGMAFCIIFSGLFGYTLFYVHSPQPDLTEEKWWKTNVVWREKNKILLLSLLAFLAVGFGVLSYQGPAHNIKNIWLLQGGNHVTIHTYGPFNTTLKMTKPLENVSCTHNSRGAKEKDIFIKVKGRKWHYFIDTRGSFPLPTLFDQTIGLQRKLYSQ